MKRITVSVPDEVFRAARLRAEDEGTSVSAMVANYLRSLANRDAEFERLEQLQREVQQSIGRFSGADRLSRDEIHDRSVR